MLLLKLNLKISHAKSLETLIRHDLNVNNNWCLMETKQYIVQNNNKWYKIHEQTRTVGRCTRLNIILYKDNKGMSASLGNNMVKRVKPQAPKVSFKHVALAQCCSFLVCHLYSVLQLG